jgi:predicted ArsR family transcriptional regulator
VWSGCENLVRSPKREEKTKKLILETLQKNPDGLTISDVARILSIHYTTASKYLAVMEALEIVVRKDFGMAKVFRVNGK